MSIARRMAGVGLSTVAMVGAMAAFGPSAQAAGAQRIAGLSACSAAGNHGTLCVTVVKQGYDISFNKVSAGTSYMDFNLVCDNGRWFGDEGAFSISKGQTRSYVFAVGDMDTCRGKLIDKRTGGTWLTGRVTK